VKSGPGETEIMEGKREGKRQCMPGSACKGVVSLNFSSRNIRVRSPPPRASGNGPHRDTNAAHDGR